MVLRHNESIVGFLTFNVIKHESIIDETYHDTFIDEKVVLFIPSICSYHKGIGTILLDRLKYYFSDKVFKHLEIELEPIEEAVNFYKKRGFDDSSLSSETKKMKSIVRGGKIKNRKRNSKRKSKRQKRKSQKKI
jgi:hypothetical protein